MKRLGTSTHVTFARFPRKSSHAGPQMFQLPPLVVPRRFTQLEVLGKVSLVMAASPGKPSLLPVNPSE